MAAERWPLVGRSDELGLALDAVEHWRGVVLSGVAGVGKTRLAAEVLARSAEAGWEVVSLAAGTETAAIPFSPFAPLLEGDTEGDAVSRFVRATHAIESRGDRVLVAVDDAHLLDDVSVAFVRHLLASTAARIVLTVRSGEVTPPSLVTLWQTDLLRRVEVLALARDETDDVVASGLGGAIDPTVLLWVWETTSGNPLFVRELVLDAIDRAALVRRDDRWVLAADARGAGARLREIVAARVGALSDAERMALELLALGEPLGLAMLESLVGFDVVQRLEARELVTARPDRRRMRVRLAHPLHGEVVRATMGGVVAHQRRRQLIDAFSAVGTRRRDDEVRLAVWRCEIGDVEDWRALLDAARELARASKGAFVSELIELGVAIPAPSFDHLEQAARLARGALDGGGSLTAAALLVRILVDLGRLDDARAVDAEMAGLAVDEEGALAATRLRAEIAMYGDGDPRAAIEILDSFETRAVEPSHVLAVRASKTAILALSGDPEGAIGLGRPLLDDERASRSDRLLATASVGGSLGEQGRPSAGLEMVESALGGATPDDPMDALGTLLLVRITLLTYVGRIAEADALAQLCHDAALRSGEQNGAGVFAVVLANVALAAGDPARAATMADEGRRRMVNQDPYGLGRNVLSVRVHASAHIGDLPSARAAVAALDAHPARPGMFTGDELRARSWLDVAEGRTTAAIARLQAGAETFASLGRVMREATALHDLARLGQARHVVTRLATLAVGSDTPVIETMDLHAQAADAADPAALTGVGERWKSMGFALYAAEAFAQAGSVHTLAGRTASATASGARSRAATTDPSVVTPALSLSGPASSLTPREREIAGLAAKGQSDREIADVLVVSIRTVHTHLYNAYSKLGVDGRSELASVLDL